MTQKTAGSLVEQISTWMRGIVNTAGAKGVVLGLSGGLDSAVVAALAKIACGEEVLALIMPCHSSPDSATDAMMVASKLGIKTHTADLTASYDALVSEVSFAEGIALANVPPRLRMTALYCAAQSHRYLVAGTTNKTENLIGYFTKWGDSPSDLSPIGELYKYQVRQLAVELNLPKEIIEKPPSADLWPGQTDEKEIGMTYDELDSILQAIQSGKEQEYPEERVQKVKKMIAVSEHKRRPTPVFEPIDISK